MTTHLKSRQQGQAMTEFIAAMALFIPLVLGVIYLGKYSDIKHQAVQASRYAALERAMDPQGHEQAGAIQKETVARFFRDGSKEKIALNEAATGSTTADANPNWSQMNGSPMIAQYSDIQVDFSNAGSLATPLDSLAGQQFDLASGSGVKADVKVPIAAITHFDALNKIVTVTASTVMAGDPWNGGDAAQVANHFNATSVPFRNPVMTALKFAIGAVAAVLTDAPAPQFGCVKPDIVPGDAAPGAKYDPMADPSSSDDPNECHN